MYKLLATDLDGTLLNNLCEIPANNRTAIQKALAQGVHVCLCSGRPYLSMRPFEEQLGLRGDGHYGIAFNGAMVYETKDHHALRDLRLDHTLAMEIIDAMAPYSGDMLVYDGSNLFARDNTVALRLYVERVGISVQYVDSFASLKGHFSKVLLRGKHDMLLDVQAAMRLQFADRCNIFLTERNLLEFTAPSADKGSALIFLADRLGIDMREVIAIGDNFNDLHMIGAAGLGVATANAVDAAKEAAGYVTRADNNAGALAELIDKFIV